MTALLDARPRRDRSRARTLADLFFRRLAQSAYARQRQWRRGRRVLFEALEPRLLLSASLMYGEQPSNPADILSFDPLVTDMTLTAELDSGDVFLRLRETSNLGNIVGSVELDDAGDVSVEITRDDWGLGDEVLDVAGDTIRIDLASFDLAELSTFINANGSLLDIDFAGGKDISIFSAIIPGILDDQVVVQGTSATTIPFSLSLHSTSDILVTALFRAAFQYSRYGFAAAFAFVIFAILLVFTVFYVRCTKALKGAYE